jgi:hypothetical protein
VGEFCCPEHLAGSIVDDRQSGRLAAWVNLDPQLLAHRLRLGLLQNEHKGKAAQDSRLALLEEQARSCRRARMQRSPLGINNQDA